jgi:hypothetical protein
VSLAENLKPVALEFLTEWNRWQFVGESDMEQDATVEYSDTDIRMMHLQAVQRSMDLRG